MNWPTSQDYNEAVQDAANNFADETMRSGEVVVNALGLPVPRSGNFADVYQFKDGNGRLWALKCFTRKVAGLHERYVKIDEHLAKHKLPFTVGFKFLEEGIRVKGAWFPLLKMEWVEGFTLNDFVAENLSKPHYLHALMQMWAKLAGRLRDANMAHADLQHGNVLLVPGATPQKLGLKLIDYDGMWVPALADVHSGEMGHPNFQHPLRLKDRLYNGDVDRFAHLVVAAGLRGTLVGGKAIWDRFDNSDNLLFKEADLRDPAKATVFKALWDLNDPILRTLVGHIALSAKQPLRKTPWLDEIVFAEGGPKLTADEEQQVCTLLGVSRQTVATDTKRAPAHVEQQFNVFDFLDEEDNSPEPATTRPSRQPAASSKKERKPEKRPAKKPQQKSLLPLLVGGGVVAVLLVVGVIVAISLGGGKKKDMPPEVVQNKDEPKPKWQGPETTPKKTEESNPKKTEESNPKKTEAITNAKPIENADDLRAALSGTQWDWAGEPLTFRTDGTVGQARWEARRLRTSAVAVDRRTVVLIVDQGRNNNVYSVLQFSDDLGQCIAHSFEGEKKTQIKRIGGPAQPLPVKEVDEELKRDLSDTAWEWDPGADLHLNADGSTSQSLWDNHLKLRTSWQAIDRRTVMLRIEAGRTSDYYAVLQLSEDLREFNTRNFLRSPLRTHKRVGSPAAPLTASTGVAPLPGGKDYLFIRLRDPALYATVNGSPRKAREVGRHGSPIHTFAVSPDGTRVLTGAEDGEVRVWPVKESGVAASDPRTGLTTVLAKFKKIDIFNNRFSFDAHQEGVVIYDHANGKEQVILAGQSGYPLKGVFKSNHEKEAARLGLAVTEEVQVFNGDLTVQLFEGGIQLYYKPVDKTWYGWHIRRIPIKANPVPPAVAFKTKVLGPAKFVGFKRPYEYTLYREGIVIRDLDANKEVTVRAGTVVNSSHPSFKDDFSYDKLAKTYGSPVSLPTDVFDGALKIVLCRRGFFVNQTGTSRNWNSQLFKDIIGEEGPPKSPLAEASGVAMKQHTGPVVASTISVDGTRAVTVGKDNLLCEWDIVESKLIRKFKVPESCSVAYLPDNKSVILGTVSEGAGVWELARERRVTELPGHAAAVRSVCVSPSATLAWTGSDDGTIQTWSLRDFKPVSRAARSEMPPSVRALAVSPNGRVLACLVADGTVRFFDARNGQPAGTLAGKSPTLALAFLNDGEMVAARDPDPIKVRVTEDGVQPPPISPK